MGEVVRLGDGPGTPEIIRLGDREFDLVEDGSLERELYLAAYVRRGGLDLLRRDPGETAAQYQGRVYGSFIGCGVTVDLVASQITPRGERWDSAVAAETARYLRQLSVRENNPVLKRLVVLMVEELAEGGSIHDWIGEQGGGER